MDIWQLTRHNLRFGLWRGLQASLIGSATFGGLLLAVFFGNEIITRGVWPGLLDLWLFVFPFFISFSASVIPGCVGGIILAFGHPLFASRGYPPKLTLAVGLVLGGITGSVVTIWTIQTLSLASAYREFAFLVILIAAWAGWWAAKRLVADYDYMFKRSREDQANYDFTG